MSQALQEVEIDRAVLAPGVAARNAAINAKSRDLSAMLNNPAFFNSPVHQQRVQAVEQVLSRFFTGYARMYVTRRSGYAGRPFTAVKVEKPRWPAVSHQRKQLDFYDPLTEIGNLELRHAKTSNSYIVRVY
jgi:hypothetical protein